MASIDTGIMSTPRVAKLVGIRHEREPLNASGWKFTAHICERIGEEIRIARPLYLSAESISELKTRVMSVEWVSGWHRLGE
jgi:hypothetical protein